MRIMNDTHTQHESLIDSHSVWPHACNVDVRLMWLFQSK